MSQQLFLRNPEEICAKPGRDNSAKAGRDCEVNHAGNYFSKDFPNNTHLEYNGMQTDNKD